jgi:branched-chain amino acid transport system substrate-binding protein
MACSRSFRHHLMTLACATAVALTGGSAVAEEPLKIGVIVPLTGGLAPVGKQALAGAQLYVAQHGDVVPGERSR